MAIDYTTIFERLGWFLGTRRRVNYLAEVMALYASKVWTILSGAEMSNWAFTGVKRGANTDVDGKLYAELVDLGAPGGPYQVEVFKDAAKAPGDLVASGQIVATSGTIGLTEKNNSGLTGSVDIVWTIDDTTCELILDIAWPRQTDSWLKDNSDKDRADAQSDLDTGTQNILEGISATLSGINSSMLSNMDSNFWLVLVAILIDSGEAGVWTPTETVQAGGEVVVSKSGVLQDLIDFMIDDVESVQENAVTFPALSGVASPVGSFAQTSRVAYPYVRNEKIKLRCVKTITGTLEEFELTGGLTGAAPNRLRLGATFRSLDLGVELLLERDLTTTSTALTNIVLTGESSANISSEGKLYTRLTNPTGTTLLLEVFTHSSRTEEFKVAEGQRDGNGVIVATAYGAFGGSLRIQADVAYVGDEDAEMNLQISQLNDVWESTLTNDEAGIFQTMIGRIYSGAAFPDDAVPTIDERTARIVIDEIIKRDGWEGQE